MHVLHQSRSATSIMRIRLTVQRWFPLTIPLPGRLAVIEDEFDLQRGRAGICEALVLNHGNATAAARSLKYDNPKGVGHRYSRHPLVLKALAPLAQQHLSALTPKAVQTLATLLHAKSAFVRLEAAKDILDRNGVGTSHEAPRSSQLVVNINLGSTIADASVPPVVLENEATPMSPNIEAGPESLGSALGATSPAHDFSTEALDDREAQPLQVKRSSIPSRLKQEGAPNFFVEESDFDLE
jgi:hypothetical protein